MDAEHKVAEGVIVEGSGNVFADLGLPASEEDMLKVHMAHAITNTIRRRGLTQAAAAKLMGIDQAKVSAITRGQLKGVSVARLFRYLLLLGRDVDIRISQRCRGDRGRIKIQAA